MCARVCINRQHIDTLEIEIVSKSYIKSHNLVDMSQAHMKLK